MENLTACPICNHEQASTFMTCKDYTVSGDDFAIVECGNCGFKFTNPRPAENEIGKYYKSEDYISHSNTSKGVMNTAYQSVRKVTVRNKFLLANSLSAGKRILDYGCGTGEFLRYCKDHGFDVTGFEPDPDARKLGIENHGLDLLDEEALFGLPDDQFDIITLWHVLEHVHRLKETIYQLKRLLKPKAVMAVAVPNPTSLDAQIYQEHWAAYDVPRHLYHFGPGDIERLFGEFGFELTEVLPMKFDSYYVSMLSEKYKNGNIVKAMLNGARSNLAASSTKHTWSSQIYILRSTKS